MDTITDGILSGAHWVDGRLTQLTAPWEAMGKEWFRHAFPGPADTITQALASIRSPYADQFPLMNPFHVALIVVGYLTSVAVGQRVMQHVPTKFSVKGYALVHNAVLTYLSLFMGSEVLRQAIRGGYSLFGNPLVSPEGGGTPMAKIVAVFYLSKILEFNDTFIMVLKKNFHQITFLHVYHHASIFVIWWLVTFWAPNGEAYFSAMLNSFIHVVMYGYYFLSAMGVKQVTFVKKYITSAQMTQFACMMLQATYNLLRGGFGGAVDPTFLQAPPSRMATTGGEGDKSVHQEANNASSPSSSQSPPPFQPYPLALNWMLWWYMVTMLTLFGNFYRMDRRRDAFRKNKISGANHTTTTITPVSTATVTPTRPSAPLAAPLTETTTPEGRSTATTTTTTTATKRTSPQVVIDSTPTPRIPRAY